MAEKVDIPVGQLLSEVSSAQQRASMVASAAGMLSDSGHRRILIVDASPGSRRPLREMLRELGHEVLEVASTTEALAVVSREKIDLMLVDLLAPELGGPAFCCVMRSHVNTRLIPIFLLTNSPDSEKEAIGIGAGADDFLIRPLRPKVMLARVQATLRQKAILDSIDEAESVLFSLAQSVEARDAAIGQHCQRLAVLSSSLGVAMGLPATDLIALQRGGYLHDIGKVAVPDSILFKPGPLTPDEWVIMKQHTVKGEQICAGMKSLGSVLPIIRHHHERWDGTGYPDGLRREEIPLLARIVQIADIFDALTTERPYKQAFTPEYALQILREEAKTGWRDPVLIEAFTDIFPLFRNSEILSNSSLHALALSLKEKNRWAMCERPAAEVIV